MDKNELSSVLGHVSSSVGHQVINAFSTIVSQTEILRTLIAGAGKFSPEFPERIESIVRVSLEASTMTRRLLELSHNITSIESPGPAVHVEELDLVCLASEFVKSLGPSISPAARWELDLSPTPPIRGDARLVATALQLLAENAAEALPSAGGTITLGVRPGPREWVTLEVRDNGCGMVSEVLDRAAEPFFTTKPDRRGLGLTIARGIWRRHRGSMIMESQPDQGTTVRLTAPPVNGD